MGFAMSRPFHERTLGRAVSIKSFATVQLLVLAACQQAPKEAPPAATVSAKLAAAAPARSAPPARVAPQSERVALSAEAQNYCRAFCERSRELKCPSTNECPTNCLGMISLTPCSSEISAMFGCILREPVAHWECDEDGVGAIREGYCDKEQAAAVACMEKKMQP